MSRNVMLTLFFFFLYHLGDANAMIIHPNTVTNSRGSYHNYLTNLYDDVFPNDGTFWKDSQNVWWEGQDDGFTQFIFDYGENYLIEDIKLTVDNNDDYQVDYSLDGTNWTKLFYLNYHTGNINWGVETFSTTAGDPTYESSIDFIPVTARYLKIYGIDYTATGDNGIDNKFAIGEFQVYGRSPSTTVPEPSTLFLLGSGFVGIFLHKRGNK